MDGATYDGWELVESGPAAGVIAGIGPVAGL